MAYLYPLVGVLVIALVALASWMGYVMGRDSREEDLTHCPLCGQDWGARKEK